MSNAKKKPRTLHIARNDRLHAGSPEESILCGKKSKIWGWTKDRIGPIYTTVEELREEPLHHTEKLCPKCEKHPDYPLLWLALEN